VRFLSSPLLEKRFGENYFWSPKSVFPKPLSEKETLTRRQNSVRILSPRKNFFRNWELEETTLIERCLYLPQKERGWLLVTSSVLKTVIPKTLPKENLAQKKILKNFIFAQFPPFPRGLGGTLLGNQKQFPQDSYSKFSFTILAAMRTHWVQGVRFLDRISLQRAEPTSLMKRSSMCC